MNVIAEGVEQSEQLAFFVEHECAEWQGYFLGHPATAEEFGKVLFDPVRMAAMASARAPVAV